MPADDLSNMAVDLLEETVDVLGADAPARRILTVGAPALDCCDQLASSVLRVRMAQIGGQDEAVLGTACHGMTLVELRVTLTGCVPSPGTKGEAPDADEINTSSVPLYAAAWTMWCGLRNRLRAGSLFADLGPKRLAVIGPLIPVEPQGGCAGWLVDLLVQLDQDRDLGIEGS